MIHIFVATIFLSASILLPVVVHADGTYQIGKDDGGVYMDTEQDGSWYIDPNHLRHFSVGEQGTYTIRADHGGTFVRTGNGDKYYINWKAFEKDENERLAFNQKQRQTEHVETKVVAVDGAHILLPVSLENRGRKLEAMMLLDTGASMMVLHKEVADQLALKSTGNVQLMVAGGQIIKSDLVKLDVVGVGPIVKKGLQASVIRHDGKPVRYQGLLGMNFLKGLNYRVDYDRQVIRWDP
jgi:clan AA aspartic protease (TIGR02281 family)